ncbi:hypothetical protein REJC140_01679 [Pseudorhizobium endolithicum]|uniref:DUF423 domain-containing protein n=1 Tax=Pseudorhizobium endolithicum TaxID=1191678 RepID=A0ABN7JZB5_9HYPH|nr:DUF423 domain-containing protein [Pseudorhizobium endolithicum]CAD6409485.1 hypothetical protein REQ54_00581 [Rhizobium sp. Q54]CAD7050747.1 hypothetical protein REJC140_01679 [Pseudorhizobium endolithicum]
MERLDNLRPLILFLSGLFGAAGVALAAAASHGGDARLLGTASMMCLIHAPALVALYAGYRAVRTATLAALLIALGTLLFSGDLLARHFLGGGLFPMAAPTGGTTMILGWLVVAAGAFIRVGR